MPLPIVLRVAAALSLALAACTATPPTPAVTPPLPWPQVPCRRHVEAFLAVGGLTLADLADVRVREYRLAGGQPGEQVGHWHVTARPASCATGRIEITILADCSVDDWQALGGCRVPGLEPAP